MTLSQIPREQYEETLKGMRERCYTAIKTMGAQPPVTALGFPKDWAIGAIVRETREAYGYTAPQNRFRPNPKQVSDMLPVMGAIALYKHEALHGERDYQIIFARAYEVQWLDIREILKTSADVRSLQRWQDRACEEIINTRLTRMSDIGQNRVLRVENCA